MSLVIIWRLSLRINTMKNLNNTLIDKSKNFLTRNKILFLVLLAIIQIVSLRWLANATLIGNLLFIDNICKIPENLTFFSIAPENLKYLILYKVEDKLKKYFVQLLLIALLGGLILWQIISNYRKRKNTKKRLSDTVWLKINLFLITTQIILLPVNFGVLLLNKQYQEVKIQFNESENKKVQPSMATNVKNQPPVLINTIRDQTLALNELPFVCNLNASPVIFTDLNEDSLSYSVHSDVPSIATTAILGSTLKVSALSERKAKIRVTANDEKGKTITTSFTVKVIEEIDTWKTEVENPISDKNLTIGDPSFVYDLKASPAVFSNLDRDSLYLTYKASSSTPGKAKVTILRNKLTMTPLSRGRANITVTANDGMNRFISTTFKVVIIDRNLA